MIFPTHQDKVRREGTGLEPMGCVTPEPTWSLMKEQTQTL